MNKRHLMMAIALLSCLSLYSQKTWNWNEPTTNRDKSYRLEIGPKLGAGIARGTNPSTYSFRFKPGMAYQVGLSANAHFGRRQQQSIGGTGLFGLEADIMYGGRSLGTPAGNITMQIIEIPFLVQFYPIPSLALEIGPTMYNTQGGPRRNQFGQVLNPFKKPIPRLYSAGELGSMWGLIYQGACNNSESCVFGRIAGRTVAAEKPWC